MRLEYRYFDPASRPVILRAIGDGTHERRELRPAKGGELWLRWLPDDAFAESGIQPPTEAETAALDTFLSNPASHRFPDETRGAAGAAWARLVADVGSEWRAAHLWRSRGNEAEPSSFDARAGRLCGLPDEVVVFAVTKGKLVEIARGEPITARPGKDNPGDVSYAPALLDGGGWLTDFDSAVSLGMGARVTEPELVAAAKDCDWLVATGVSAAHRGKDGAGEFEAWLADAVANGRASFLATGSATNNAGEEVTGESRSGRKTQAANTFDWEQKTDQSGEGAGAQLAEALGLSASSLGRVPGSATPHRKAAAAMMRVIGPALLDDKLDASTVFDGLDEVEVIDTLAETVLARGPYSPMKIGTAAFGLAPVADPATLDIAALPGKAHFAIAGYAKLFLRLLGGGMAAHAEKTTPRLEPGDPEAAEILSLLLQSYPGARRLDILDEAAHAEARQLGCAYVTGKGNRNKPGVYLNLLIEKSLDDLEDPTGTDESWPLLYRIARRSLTRNLQFRASRADLTGTRRPGLGELEGALASGSLGPLARRRIDDAGKLALIELESAGSRTWSALGIDEPEPTLKFVDALRTLAAISAEDEGTAKLEELMMEVIDILQYRLDAWATGVAGMALDVQRDTGTVGLDLGWFGMLEGLRTETVTGRSDGYIQAPTPGQARTAAALRSAQLRHAGGGAFDIDLSSRRVRRGLDLLDRLSVGVPLGAALGHLGEKLLRQRAPGLIPVIRARHPRETPDSLGQGAAPDARGVFDGLSFLDAKPGEGDLGWLHARLDDALDAVADLVLAEAVHARALGAAERANAWLSVLSGGPAPDRPEFIRTHRRGQASDHRILLCLDDATEPGVLSRSDPGLAALARNIIGDPGDVVVTVRDGDTAPLSLSLAWEKLAIEPLEILFSAPPALARRVLRRALRQSEGVLGHRTIAGLMASPDLAVEISIDGQPAAAWVETMARHVKLLTAARPLEPADWQPFNASGAELLEAAEIPAWQRAFDDLSARHDEIAATLADARDLIDKHRVELVAAGDTARPNGGRHARAIDEILDTIAATMPARALPIVALAGEGETLVAAEDELIDICELQRKRLKAAARMRPARPVSSSDLAPWKEAVGALRRAIRTLTGRDGLPVLPRFDHVPDTLPALQPATTLQEGLDEWPELRLRVRQTLALGQVAGPLGLRRGVDRGEITPQDDPRDEETSPRKHHFARVIGKASALSDRSGFSGLVLDEWVEMRPSMEQPATLAVNYDAPASEAPNMLPICVPSAELGSWTAETAAAHVMVMVEQMQLRSATTQSTLLEAALLPGANSVHYKRSGGQWVPRLPVKTDTLVWRAPSDLRGRFTTGGGGPRGMAAAGLNEIGGRGGKRSGR